MPEEVLVGTGPKKTEAITKTVARKVTPAVPASTLQLHENATIIVDKDAAQELLELAKKQEQLSSLEGVKEGPDAIEGAYLPSALLRRAAFSEL